MIPFTPEHHAFRDSVRRWVDDRYPRPVVTEMEREEGVFPYGLHDDMTKAGYHAIGIDEQYGGAGGDVITQAILAEELGRNLAGMTWAWAVSSFAGAKSIGVYGTEEQKERYLPRLAAGEIRFAFAATEPGGGTDVLGAMTTYAERDGDTYVLNGRKIWSTGSDTAQFVIVLARTERAPARKTEGTGLFIVPNPSPGLTVNPLPKLGMRAINSCELVFDDVVVPADAVLGEPGRAWHQLVKTLNNERVVVSAICTGIITGVLEEMLEHVRTREAFGRPIGQFQALQHQIADVVMMRDQAQLLTYRAAFLQAAGEPDGLESSMAKCVASEYASKAADIGIQLLGGMGYSAETSAQRYWRDSRIYRIGPISNEMVRNMIAEHQGLPRSF
jgi:acyl-CoA dehydrogenase